MKKKHQAFTLIEMTVVLIVVSILVLVFIPKLSAQKEQASKRANEAVVQAVKTQLELYELEYGVAMPEEERIKQITPKRLEIYNNREDQANN